MNTPTPDPGSSSFGPYRLLRKLGEGGMGVVHQALDLRLERVVALKLLKGDSEEKRKALVAEAKTACQLQHPNIAVIFDAGDVDGTPFIAMEYVEGQNLAEEQGRQLPLPDLLAVATQVGKALAHAHQRGIVHRDIKPDNLVLTPEGVLKVLDFGVAKRGLMGDGGDHTAQAFTRVQETAQGISVGTPAYMSPEQAYGRLQGPSADQFSLGVVLFELAAGVHPFRKEALVETLHAIAREPHPDLGRLRPDLPAAFVSTVHRMLAKDALDRFPDLLKALEPLEALQADLATGRRPSPIRRERRRRSLLRGAALGLAGAGLLFGSFFLASRWRIVGTKSELPVVAVLPVELEGVPAELAWAGRSFQDAMGMGLLRQGGLLVLDRLRVSEALAAVGSGSLGKLEQELGAQLLVMGSLRSNGDRLRLTVRILKGERGEVVDQLQLQGTAQGLLDLEDELVRRLPALVGRRGASNEAGAVPRAHLAVTRERYTEALDLVMQGNQEALARAQRLFEAALAQEPEYAPARAGLAWALLERAHTGVHLGQAEAKAFGQGAVLEARRALTLDPKLPFAHRVLAAALHRQGDLAEAETAANRAVQLDPADFRAWIVLGDVHAHEADSAAHLEAARQYQRALDLRPGDWFAHFRLAVLQQNDGDLEEALRHADEARRLQPSAEYAHLTAALSALWLGRDGDARIRLEEGLKQVPGSRLLAATQAILAHGLGDDRLLRRGLDLLKGAWPAEHPISVLLAGLAEAKPEARWRAFLDAGRRGHWETRPLADRRTLSVNLYHMARIMARTGQRDLATDLLNEAERLHPGKRAVARRDPLLKALATPF